MHIVQPKKIWPLSPRIIYHLSTLNSIRLLIFTFSCFIEISFFTIDCFLSQFIFIYLKKNLIPVLIRKTGLLRIYIYLIDVRRLKLYLMNVLITPFLIVFLYCYYLKWFTAYQKLIVQNCSW